MQTRTSAPHGYTCTPHATSRSRLYHFQCKFSSPLLVFAQRAFLSLGSTTSPFKRTSHHALSTFKRTSHHAQGCTISNASFRPHYWSLPNVPSSLWVRQRVPLSAPNSSFNLIFRFKTNCPRKQFHGILYMLAHDCLTFALSIPRLLKNHPKQLLKGTADMLCNYPTGITRSGVQ